MIEKVPWRRWAEFRLGVIGHLLASPPSERGELRHELEKLATKVWVHPIKGEPLKIAFSTIERWFYAARHERQDTVAALARRQRQDAGHCMIIGDLKTILDAQYKIHSSWSAKLHADNLAAACRKQGISPVPSYQTVRRYLRRTGKDRMRRRRALRDSEVLAHARQESHEVRSFEFDHVGGLLHLDFHVGSHQIATEGGLWLSPKILAVIDDHSRLICHAQWYLTETTRDLVHGFSQALMRRGLPRKLMTDNGAAMLAAEFTQGLDRLGIIHDTTLAYSPHQNGKMECFWGQLEGRLMAMLEGEKQLSLELLNRATHAWIEGDYHRAIHSETGQTPVDRFRNSPSVMRPSPAAETLRDRFRQHESRIPRRSDGTLTVEGVRYEIPSRFRHLRRVHVRYARWDLSQIDLVCPNTDRILSRLLPLDKSRNANARRRPRDECRDQPDEPSTTESSRSPLLDELLAEFAATGLPPPYLPQD